VRLFLADGLARHRGGPAHGCLFLMLAALTEKETAGKPSGLAAGALRARQTAWGGVNDSRNGRHTVGYWLRSDKALAVYVVAPGARRFSSLLFGPARRNENSRRCGLMV